MLGFLLLRGLGVARSILLLRRSYNIYEYKVEKLTILDRRGLRGDLLKSERSHLILGLVIVGRLGLLRWRGVPDKVATRRLLHRRNIDIRLSEVF